MSDDLRARLGHLALEALDGKAVAGEVASLPGDLAARFRTWFAVGPSAMQAPERPSRFGAYVLLRLLGQGAQAAVYLAEDTRLKRQVALKVLQGAERLPPEALARFRREAEAAARVDHPGICPVYEAGEVDGTPYLALRHVEGGTLAQRLEGCRRAGARVLRLDPAGADAAATAKSADSAALRAHTLRVVELIEDVARALHAAHEKGLVHRDIKPGNILLAADGRPLLADFGLARDLERAGVTLTRPGALFGTPHYVSPEQLTRRAPRLDRRTDVFSLGVVLHECLTLERPFDGPTALALYQAILTQEPEDPRQLNRAIPPDLRVVVETALQKDRDKRYLTAAALADDLRAVRELKPIRARALSRVGRVVRWTRREPWKAALAAAVFLILPAAFGVSAYAAESRSEAQLGRAHELRKRVDDHVDEGYFKLLAGDLEGSRSDLDAALRVDPTRPPVLALAGLAYLEGEPAKVLRYVESHGAGLEDDPDYDALHAMALALNGDPEGWQRVMGGSRARASAVGHFLAGYQYLSGHSYDHGALSRAEEEFRLAVRKSSRPFYSAVVLWGRAASAVRQRTSVERSVRILEDLWGDRPQTWAAIAGILEEVAEHTRARAAAQRALDVDPGSYQALEVLMLAAFHELEGGKRRLEDAEDLVQRMLELHPDAVLPAHVRGRIRFARGRWDEAREAWRDAILREPPPNAAFAPFGLVSIAESLHLEGRSGEALLTMEQAALDFPRNGWARRGLAAILLDLGELDSALARVDEALRLDGASPSGHYLRGRILLRQGDRAGALAEWDAARRLDPEYASAPSFVHAQQDGGDTLPGLRAALDLGCELFPYEADMHVAVARFLLHPFPIPLPGDEERALLAAEEAARLAPRADVAATLARARYRAGDVAAACAAAERALGGARSDDPWREPLATDLLRWRAELGR